MRRKRGNSKARARSEVREQRRETIASGLIANKPVETIAREIGITREWCSKEANSPGTRTIVQKLLLRRSDKLERIVDKSLTAVEDGLEATQISGSADHDIRLRVVGRACNVLGLAEEKRPAGAGDGGGEHAHFSGTLEELLRLFAGDYAPDRAIAPGEAERKRFSPPRPFFRPPEP